jgi:hypothetical protein
MPPLTERSPATVIFPDPDAELVTAGTSALPVKTTEVACWAKAAADQSSADESSIVLMHLLGLARLCILEFSW